MPNRSITLDYDRLDTSPRLHDICDDRLGYDVVNVTSFSKQRGLAVVRAVCYTAPSVRYFSNEVASDLLHRPGYSPSREFASCVGWDPDRSDTHCL